jgi:hypothetical protein
MIFARAQIGLALAVSAASPALADTRNEYVCGETRLVVRTIQDLEDQHVTVQFLEMGGKEKRPSVTAPGEFVSLCKQRKFLLLNTDTHHLPGPSWLMSADGELIAKIELGQIAEHGAASDERIFWTQAFMLRGQNWVTRVRVFDMDGAEIQERTYGASGVEQVLYEGRAYEIRVLKPDMPG